jgi:hypothetical protein
MDSFKAVLELIYSDRKVSLKADLHFQFQRLILEYASIFVRITKLELASNSIMVSAGKLIALG